MDSKKKRILIIEDSPELSKVVASALREANFDIETASNGTQGIEIVKTNQFNLVLLDLVMPERSGFEVLNSFQTMGIETPIIVYSNMPTDFSEEEVLRRGAKKYLEKTKISIDELIEQINIII